MTRLRAFLKTPAGRKAEHLLIVFLGGFGATLLFNGEHIFNEHGLSALESGAPALLMTAVYGGWLKLRPSLPVTVVEYVEKAVADVKASRAKKAATPPA